MLDQNAGALRAAGVVAWTPDRTRAGLFSGLIQRPEDITEPVERRGQRSAGLIGVELGRLRAAGMRRLVVSEENMLGTIGNNLRERCLYPLADERLLRFAGAFGAARRVGIAVRSYDQYWASALAYAVARGRRMPSAGELARLVAQPRRWRDVIADAARVFPRAEILVWSFERHGARPDAVLTALTDNAPLAVPAGARRWAHASPRRDRLRHLLRDRGDMAALAMVPHGDGRWMPFDADQQEAMSNDYAADIDWLIGGAGGLARYLGAGPAAADTTTAPGRPGQGLTGPDVIMPPGLSAQDRGQDDGRQKVVG